MTREKEKIKEGMYNWTNYCATNNGRHQCSRNNCTMWYICKIKKTNKQILEEVKEWLSKLFIKSEVIKMFERRFLQKGKK